MAPAGRQGHPKATIGTPKGDIVDHNRTTPSMEEVRIDSKQLQQEQTKQAIKYTWTQQQQQQNEKTNTINENVSNGEHYGRWSMKHRKHCVIVVEIWT